MVHGERPRTYVIWLARINKSGSAIDIINPINIPKIITFQILSKRPKKSPIIVPILEIDRSTPDRKIERPMITPKEPRRKLISRLALTPIKY